VRTACLIARLGARCNVGVNLLAVREVVRQYRIDLRQGQRGNVLDDLVSSGVAPW